MIRAAALAAALLATGCASTGGPAAPAPADVARIDATLRANFTPEDQPPHMDRLRVARGDRPFRGDCDDFAMAAAWQAQRAGLVPTVVVVRVATGRSEPHSLTCAAGWCFDSYAREAYPEAALDRRYPAVLRRIEVAPGMLALTEEE